MTVERGLGEDLRALRVARRLSLGAAAIRAGLSKSALMGWEAGRSRPRGPGFARLLDVLEAEPRPRARLLHAADPQHARIELANTALGAPVDVGAVIRAMRGRRGMTQAELARAAGVTQATVARWESGDAIPSGENLHASAFALGASPEEAVALACAQGVPSGRLPDAPFGSLHAMNLGIGPHLPRGPLHEVMSLGLEAELWPRAARDGRWDAMLAFVLGDRAVQHFLAGRLEEAEATGRRGLRLPPTPLVRLFATPAFSALLEVATHRGAPPELLAEKIEAWNARLPEFDTGDERAIKPWMRWEQALRLGEMGRPDEGLTLIERDLKPCDDPTGFWTSAAWKSEQARQRIEIELRAGRGDRAEDWLTDCEGVERPDRFRLRVRIAHAQGRAADETTMATMRAEPLGPADHWYTRSKLTRIEREQTRLARTA